ncbi:hypothetical protein [Notoacmeibacter sp. MSK16QG-6]|uniref:hypothetical protein n=1 Tax=Notoacmeibacter sp. MSK16QG-6 TaxID=2957982 RepID=UPI0020A213BD|nr:hypothetical protein [Notoacmeibacter sp. MSK16QG-6]MCP1201119.1 hypothetical protein [Notoacmeibacter sp. MSK16QG-6]
MVKQWAQQLTIKLLGFEYRRTEKDKTAARFLDFRLPQFTLGADDHWKVPRLAGDCHSTVT